MRLLTLVLACLATGCAAIDRIYDEARWQYDGFAVATYTWHVESDPVRCGIHYNMTLRYWGCAVRTLGSTPQPGAKHVPGTTGTRGHCFIYSNVPEDEAKRLPSIHGDDLWSHELRHCLGWVHPRR